MYSTANVTFPVEVSRWPICTKQVEGTAASLRSKIMGGAWKGMANRLERVY